MEQTRCKLYFKYKITLQYRGVVALQYKDPMNSIN